MFFDMLDEEFEKVNKFYIVREIELVEKGEVFNK